MVDFHEASLIINDGKAVDIENQLVQLRSVLIDLIFLVQVTLPFRWRLSK